jgi:hypothetical protein
MTTPISFNEDDFSSWPNDRKVKAAAIYMINQDCSSKDAARVWNVSEKDVLTQASQHTAN